MKDKLEKVKTTRLLSTKWKLFLGVGNMYEMRGEDYRGLAVDDDDVVVINHHLNSHRPHSRLHLHLPQLPHTVFRVCRPCKVKVNIKVNTSSMLWYAWVKEGHYRFCRQHWTWQDGRVRTWYSARKIDSLQTEKNNLHKKTRWYDTHRVWRSDCFEMQHEEEEASCSWDDSKRNDLEHFQESQTCARHD